jgi:hypothetical protein
MQKYIEFFYNMGNFILGNYFNCKSKIFFIDNISDNKHTNTKYLLFKFYFFYYALSFFKLLPVLIYNYTKKVADNLNDHHHTLIKIKITNGKLTRNLIFKNMKFRTLINHIKHIDIHQPKLFDENEMMMVKKVPILDIYYKDPEKVSIKNVISQYTDKSKNFIDHTIKNILELEKVTVTDNKIFVTFLKIGKKIDKEYNLEESEYHISDIFEL